MGHIMRSIKYELLQLIIKGYIEGKRSIGRTKMWLHKIRRWTGLHTVHRTARERQKNLVVENHVKQRVERESTQETHYCQITIGKRISAPRY